MKICPIKTKQQCKLWEHAIISVVLLISVISITDQFTDWSAFKQIIMSIAVVGCIIWSLWIVRSFYGIISWWADLKSAVAEAEQLLKETKQDLKDIKSSL